MEKSKELKQFQLKPCTVVLTKLSESKVVSVISNKSAPCASLTCHICQKKKFKNKKSVDQHVKYYHLLPPRHKCEVCDKTFRGKHGLELHSYTHKDKTESPFPCSYCPKRYKSECFFQDHLRRHLNEKPFTCVQCEKAYSSRSALRRHEINFHNVNKGSFVCGVCNRIFANLGTLQVHIKYIHGNPTIHKCKVCGKGFPRKSALTRHSKIHESDSKVFACGFCESRFPNFQDLTNHMNTHTKEKVECKLCNKLFATEKILKTHVRIIHCSSELADAFPCLEQNCTKKYATSAQLKRHRKTHLDYELWPLQCNFCNKRFLRDNGLQAHVLTHTNETLFWCTQCPKQYKSSAGLSYHARRHSSKTLN